MTRSVWSREYADDFICCDKCAPLGDHEEDKWCDSCKQNFAYTWKLENENQILQSGLDKVTKILLGLDHIIHPEKRGARRG